MVGLIFLGVFILLGVVALWAKGIDEMHEKHPDYKGEDLFGEEVYPIYKFNNGRGAMLCNICRTIISTGPKTEELYCKKCKGEKIVQDYYDQMDKEVHFNRGNLNK